MNRPKSTALKMLEGNPGKRPLNVNEPKPKRGIPACPEYLDDVARASWDYEAEILDRVGVLTEADQGILEMRSYMRSEIHKLRATLEREGRVVETFIIDKEGGAHRGNLKTHPAAIQLNHLLKEFRITGNLLGLDPSSRSKLKIELGSSEEDDFLDFLERREYSVEGDEE